MHGLLLPALTGEDEHDHQKNSDDDEDIGPESVGSTRARVQHLCVCGLTFRS